MLKFLKKSPRNWDVLNKETRQKDCKSERYDCLDLIGKGTLLLKNSIFRWKWGRYSC